MGVNCCEICEVLVQCNRHLNHGGTPPDDRLCACAYETPDEYTEALANLKLAGVHP